MVNFDLTRRFNIINYKGKLRKTQLSFGKIIEQQLCYGLSDLSVEKGGFCIEKCDEIDDNYFGTDALITFYEEEMISNYVDITLNRNKQDCSKWFDISNNDYLYLDNNNKDICHELKKEDKDICNGLKKEYKAITLDNGFDVAIGFKFKHMNWFKYEKPVIIIALLNNSNQAILNPMFSDKDLNLILSLIKQACKYITYSLFYEIEGNMGRHKILMASKNVTLNESKIPEISADVLLELD